jgi:hypothetical protein
MIQTNLFKLRPTTSETEVSDTPENEITEPVETKQCRPLKKVATTDAVTENVNQKALSSIEDSMQRRGRNLKRVVIIFRCKIMIRCRWNNLWTNYNDKVMSVKDHVEIKIFLAKYIILSKRKKRIPC